MKPMIKIHDVLATLTLQSASVYYVRTSIDCLAVHVQHSVLEVSHYAMTGFIQF